MLPNESVGENIYQQEEKIAQAAEEAAPYSIYKQEIHRLEAHISTLNKHIEGLDKDKKKLKEDKETLN
ncbi:hypothetical protein JSO59_009905 [Riemerella anatipestifer]|uniref:hypothetical protein n=1 Tax=Riemerella anatipestifer TaxID=34085 RepID=UPI0030BCA414